VAIESGESHQASFNHRPTIKEEEKGDEREAKSRRTAVRFNNLLYL
jgi:hypothetical protein